MGAKGLGTGVPWSHSYLHKELAAAVAQQLMQAHLHIKGRPLPADVQVLPRQAEAHAIHCPTAATQPAHATSARVRAHHDTYVW